MLPFLGGLGQAEPPNSLVAPVQQNSELPSRLCLSSFPLWVRLASKSNGHPAWAPSLFSLRCKLLPGKCLISLSYPNIPIQEDLEQCREDTGGYGED